MSVLLIVFLRSNLKYPNYLNIIKIILLIFIRYAH